MTPTPTELCTQARELADTQADVDGVVALLEQAQSAARSAADLAAVALARLQILGERAQAEALLLAASCSSAHDARALGEAWRALKASLRAEDLLTGRAEALTAAPVGSHGAFEEALVLVRAAAAWELPLRIHLYLDLAARHAVSVEDWIALGRVSLTLEGPSERTRASLQEAARRATTGRRGQPRALAPEHAAALLPLLASAGEEETLSQLAPEGLRPHELGVAQADLPGWTSDPAALFDWLRARLRPAQLSRVASADWGTEYPLHLQHLEKIVASGRLPPALAWNPGEVLRLCRWSEGPQTDHLVRAFCVAVLGLYSGDNAWTYHAPILVESALALGPPVPTLAQGLMVWAYETVPSWHDEDRLALLCGLALLCAAADPADPRILPLAEAAARAQPDEEDWHRTTSADLMHSGLRGALWRSLVARILEPAEARPGVAHLLRQLQP